MASSVAFTGETTSPATTPTKSTQLHNVLAESGGIEETTTAAAARPKQLFATNETTTLTSTTVKPQLAHSPITAAATATATSAQHRFTSPTSPSGGGSNSNSSATSPSFLPDMPQWKKDLIQRRKTNVARTLGAATGTGTGGTGTGTANNSRCSSLSGLTPTSSCSSLASSTATSSNYSPRTSFSSPALAAMTNADHQLNNTAPDAWHATAEEINSTLYTRTIETKVIKQTTTTTTTAASQADKDEYKTYEEMLNEHKAVSQSAAQNTEQQQQQQKTYAKMPATTTTALNSPTKQLQQQQKSPIKEKSEMKFVSGGHYTPQAMKMDKVVDGSAVEAAVEAGAAVEEEQATAAPKELILIGGAASSTITANVPIPKQRSTICLPTGTTATTTTAKHIEKEHNISSLSERRASATANTQAITQTSATTTTQATRLTGYGSTHNRGEPLSGGESASNNYKRIPSTQSTNAAASMQANTFTANQLHSKNDNERTVASVSTALTASAIQQNNLTIATTNKISTKLQNNTFIKNQQNLANTSPKYYKYKAHASQDSAYGGINLTTTAGAATTGSTSSLNSNCSSNNSQTTAAVASLASPPTTTTQTANTIINKKKMVAVQEMKKTTATADTNMSNNTKLKDNTSATKGQTSDLDGIEDLSYGPGIVSKLRCRYLSLALRESMEKERHNVDNMRRATSLSNLLERDDHEEEEDDDEEEVGEHEQQIENSAETANVPQQQLNNSHEGTVTMRGGNEVSKMRATFLKQSSAQLSKTSAYNRASRTNGKSEGSEQTGAYNSPTRTPQTQSVSVTGSAEQQITRSRQFKRGNDSIKRARSVEALLCERSPWQFVGNRSSYNPSTTPTSSGGTPTCVSIEDKIHNARERLLSGTDTTPPKRLTSIIDDTERPPPDLVKQTLRLFEATANRRRGGPQRQNSKGDVATKVANYKSIINENKPAVIFPKQPTSPTKKLTPTLKPVAKPVVAAADLINSPIGRKTLSVGNTASESEMLTPTNASTPKQQTLRSNGNSNGAAAGFLSADTPDIIPRHNVVRHLTEASEQSTASNGTAAAVMLDSPVTALTKKLEKLCFDSNNSQAATTASNNNSNTAAASALANANNSKELPAISLNKQQQQQQQQQQTQTVKHNNTNDITATTTTISTATKFVGVDALNEAKTDRASGGAPAIVASTASVDSVTSTTNAKANAAHAAATAAADTTTTTLEPHQTYNDSMQQAGSSDCSSSDLSDDEYGNASPAQKTKRITRTALENIAKAGTTQQFKFATSSPSSANKLQTAATTTSNNNAQKINGGQQSDTTTTVNNSEISSTLLNASAAGKQIGVIRPLISNANQQQQQQQQQQQEPLDLKSPQVGNYIPPAAPTTAAASSSSSSTSSSTNTQQLTTREIEKNRINEMKKTHAFGGVGGLHMISSGDSNNSLSSTSSSSLTATSSLDTVINTYASATASATAGASGYSELDAAAAAQMSVGSTNSPLWALRKKRQSPAPTAENTSMVFNFSNRKEVPDYIENDGVIIRRKRELPKPNESGFVLLDNLLVETSTDNDFDEYSMCPPSPCDVEFENANIVIDGKSSIRNKPKEATFRVQFNDTLTSTFEYPSEASLIVEEPSFSDYYANPADDLDSAFQKLMINDTQSPRQHHHVAVDEIIQLPTTTASSGDDASTPTKNVLGNLPLGSAPLGLYTPLKAPIDNLFELGVTRAPATNGHGSYPANGNNTAILNGNDVIKQNGGSIIGIKDGLNGDYNNCEDDEPESLQYLKPGNDDLNMVYSEGTQKTDLLY